jgi:hypothetical protein
MKRISVASLAALLLILFGSAGLAGASTHVNYLAGEYSATTTQHGQFKFKIEAHTLADHCGTSASSHCFIAITYPSYSEPCPGGQPLSGSFSVPNGFVSAAGNFSYHQPLNGEQEPLIDFRAHASGSKVTGTLRERDETENGTTTTFCDTGTVHWTARRI